MALSLLIVGIVTGACKARNSQSRVKGLNDSEGLAVARFDDPAERAKIPVLIYYLNESYYYEKDRDQKLSVRQNWDYLLKSINGCGSQGFNAGDTQLLKEVSDRLVSDAKDFVDAGYWEYGIIRSLMSKNPRLKNFIFKNASATSLGRESFEVQGEPTPWKSFPVLPANAEEVYRFQPLMRPEVLQSALEEVKRLAPPDKHRYVLISKSHGNATMAATAFLAKDISSLSQKQICATLLDHQKTIANAGANQSSDVLGKDTADPLGKDTADPLGKDTADPLGKDTADPLGKDGSGPLGSMPAMEYLSAMAAGKVGLDAPPSVGGLPGISKYKFSEILLNQSDMYFPIVVMESCKSEYSFADHFKSIQTKRSIPNISYVYTSDSGGLNYSNFDYQVLFRETNQGKDLQDVMKRVLELAAKK
jgi:hypothetical protein